MKRAAAAGLVLGLGVLWACGDDLQFAVPPEPMSARGSGSLPAGHPPVPSDPHAPGAAGASAPEGTTAHGSEPTDPFADPADAGHAVAGGPAPAVDRNQVFFSGRVELAPGLSLPPTYSIFVCAGAPPRGSPPVLSRKIDRPAFPVEFQLTGADLAFGDTKVDAPMLLYVIFSEKGFVLAKEGLYFKTAPTGPHALDSRDIILTLARP